MYTTGQIFEGSYPPAVAQWCKKNRAYVKEIEAVTRQQEKKILISEAEFDDEGNMISPERYKTVIEDVRVRRFQIVAIPEPTPEEQEAALQKHYTDIVQRLLDADHMIIQRRANGMRQQISVSIVSADGCLGPAAIHTDINRSRFHRTVPFQILGLL